MYAIYSYQQERIRRVTPIEAHGLVKIIEIIKQYQATVL